MDIRLGACMCALAAAGAVIFSEPNARQDAHSASPELYAPNTISTAENELNSAFTPDGRTMYFTRKAGADGKLGVILVSTLQRDGQWGTPEVASFSGRYADYDPFVSPDGSRLFFISNRPITEPGPSRDFNIWFVDRSGTGWTSARELGSPVNSDGDELYPSVALDGTLYFSSCGRKDSRGRCDLYRSRYRDGHYLDPETLGDSINTPASETDVFIAPDQSYLVFAAYGRPDALGDGDLYVSVNRDGAWSKARPLGPGINSVAREYCPIVSPDGKYLYFTSQRGFSDSAQQRALTYRELRDSLRSVRNGFGNIYRVPLAPLLAQASDGGSSAVAPQVTAKEVIPQNGGTSESAVLKTLHASDAAADKRDTATMRRLTADEYLWHASNGVVQNKTQIIAEAIAAESHWSIRKYDGLKVRIYGDVAIVTGTFSVTGTSATYRAGPRLITRLFVRRDGRWQDLGGQGTLISRA